MTIIGCNSLFTSYDLYSNSDFVVGYWAYTRIYCPSAPEVPISYLVDDSRRAIQESNGSISFEDEAGKTTLILVKID